MNRLGRWVTLKFLFFGFVAVTLSAAPATVLIGRDVHRSADVNWVPVLVGLAIAVVGFLVLLNVRTAASRRYVEAAIRSGQAGMSPAFVYTLIAWLLICVMGGIAFGTLLVYQTADGPIAAGSYRATLTKYPLPVLFLIAGLAVFGTAAQHSLTFRRRFEYPPLEQRGIARVDVPPHRLPPKEALKERTGLWLQGAAVDGAFFLGGLLPRLFTGERPTGDEWASGVFMVVGGPGIVSFSLALVMLVFWPTRRSAFQALTRASSLAAIGLVGIGFALDSADLKVASAVFGLSGLLLGSAVCMNIMDRGSQPGLGLIYLSGNYIYGYLTAPDGNSVLPTGTVGWIVAILAAAYTLKEARSHWRKWTKLQPMTTPEGWTS